MRTRFRPAHSRLHDLHRLHRLHRLPFGWIVGAMILLSLAYTVFYLLPQRRQCAERGGILLEDAAGLPSCVVNPNVAVPAGRRP